MNQSRDGWSAAGTGAFVALATFIYYLVPVPGQMRKQSWELLFWGGTAVLGALIVVSIRRLLKAGLDARARGLILLLCITVLFFSWADDVLAEIPGQFVSLHTPTDALYFSVSTLATVGFGDVHAAGQLARGAVALQIVFNLVFVGTVVAMISGLMRHRATKRITGPPAAGDHGSGDAKD